jgi:HlyD family secretion protein
MPNSAAQARHTKAQFANPQEYLAYELGQAVQELPPLYTRLLASTLCLMVFGSIAWAYYSQVDEVATAPAKLVPTRTLRPVRATNDGVIRGVIVKAGQKVQVNTPLLNIQSADKETDIQDTDIKRLTESAQLIKQEIQRLEAEDKNQLTAGSDLQNQLLTARSADFAARLQGSLAEANRQLANQREAQARLARLQENLLNARTNVDNAVILLTKSEAILSKVQEREKSLRALVSPENQAIPRLEYIETQNRVIQSEAEVTRARNEVTNAKDRVSTLEKDILAQRQTIKAAQESYQVALNQTQRLQSERQSDILTRLAQRREDLAFVTGQLNRAKETTAVETMKAPIGGTVYEVKASLGPVQKGEELLSILPTGDGVLLEAKVLNRDIGFINPGDRVKVKLTTFPYQEFGTVDGEVIQVAPNATLDEENKDLGLVYKTLIKLKTKTMLVNGKEVPLSPGMTATADIVTRQKSILTFLIEPITSRFSNAFSPR